MKNKIGRRRLVGSERLVGNSDYCEVNGWLTAVKGEDNRKRQLEPVWKVR